MCRTGELDSTKLPLGDAIALRARMERLERVADFFNCRTELDKLRPPGQPGGRATSECYHAAQLRALCPAFADARRNETHARSSAALTATGSDAWKAMVVDLAGVAPVDATEGSDRAIRTLRYSPPPAAVVANALKFRAINRVTGCADVVASPEPTAGDAVLRPREAWGDKVPPKLTAALRILRAACRDMRKTSRGECGAVIAGGGALDSVLDIGPSRVHDPADWDLFFFGMDAEEAQRALDCLILALGSTNVRVTGHAVTITVTTPMDYKNRRDYDTIHKLWNFRVQVVLRLYANPGQVVLGFDIDACKVAMWLSDAVVAESAAPLFHAIATPCAIEAWRTMTMWVDPNLQSETYAERLHKYAVVRGFRVVVPLQYTTGVSIDKVFTPGLGGLAALLRMAVCVTTPHSTRFMGLSDYEKGLSMRYFAFQNRVTQSPHEENLMRSILAKMLPWFALRNKKPQDRALVWQAHDPMRQGPLVTGMFHPCHEAFYNVAP